MTKLTVFGQEIEQVRDFEYLGLTLDINLTFNQHIDYLIKKATPKLGPIAKARKCIEHSIALMLYKSIVNVFISRLVR